jgi:ADP-ribose pyrophosphatase YjhB (NUDIX family)
MLDLPGGFLNQDESAEESLKREVKEELGINLKDFKYETSSSDIYEFNNFESRTICLLFSGKLPKNAKIKPADDVADYIFYKKESIPFEKIAFKSLSDGIKQILGI